MSSGKGIDPSVFKLGSFEEEEFQKSDYAPSKKRPHSKGDASGRPETQRPHRHRCLKCDRMFQAYSRFNKICVSCSMNQPSDIPEYGFGKLK